MSTDESGAGEGAGDVSEQDYEQSLQTLSDIVKRSAIASAMGQSWGHLDDRDYFDTLGYPDRTELDIDDYWAMFERGGIGETIITAVSGQTWSAAPTITDEGGSEEDDNQTDFESDVETLFDETGALTFLERADTLQRIGQFGVLLIGFDDGQDLDQPVDQSRLTGDPAEDILYYQPFSEENAAFEREKDPTDERFGKPVEYELDFGDDGIGVEDVHHERVIHVAEGALEDEVLGYSAYRPVFNYLVDLNFKVVGGSAEMYWRGADRKLIANAPTDAGQLPDEDKVATQVEEMVNDLRNVVWARDLELDEIEGDQPDPSGLKDALVELIAGVLRIPKRRLLGTERGDLASTQDEAAFVAMIEERRQKFAEPQFLRRFIDRLLEFDVLSPPTRQSYDVEWPENFELTEVERAEVMQRKARAFKDGASMGDPAEIATTAERREEIFGLPPERGSAVEPTPSPEDIDDDGDAGIEDIDVDDPLDETDPEVDEWFEEVFGESDALKPIADGGEEDDRDRRRSS